MRDVHPGRLVEHQLEGGMHGRLETAGLNPQLVAADGQAGQVVGPFHFVCVFKTDPRSTSRAVTAAPASDAPEGSWILPVILALASCAIAMGATAASSAIATINMRAPRPRSISLLLIVTSRHPVGLWTSLRLRHTVPRRNRCPVHNGCRGVMGRSLRHRTSLFFNGL